MSTKMVTASCIDCEVRTVYPEKEEHLHKSDFKSEMFDNEIIRFALDKIKDRKWTIQFYFQKHKDLSNGGFGFY